MAGFIWRSKEKKNLVLPEAIKRFQVATECPCCEMKVFGQQVVLKKDGKHDENAKKNCVENATTHPYRWNLTKWWGDGVGTPHAYWLLRDVGSSRWKDKKNSCSGVIYAYGKIDCKGKLLGLPEWFQTSYSYDGHMQLLQGCIDPDNNDYIYSPCGYVGLVTNSPFQPDGELFAYYGGGIISDQSNTTSLGVFLGGPEGKGNV